MINSFELPEDWYKVSTLIFSTEKELNNTSSTKEILKIHSNRTLKILNMYNNKEISKELFKYLKNKNLCDGQLIKLRIQNGYRDLCCTRCVEKVIQKKVCVCRVPSNKKIIFEECNICGCKGCSDRKIV
ncbi:hypothetical protein H312_02054 [Anncaliia algerae PRA339]|uniref:G10 protein n=1 Tax=Anncaliia algerae PRA339 TaxID=1288291 RepID=A0A059F0D4_9MICR|nr:hypothetical protein H312_02054 [Anncaliia algerae PRA339]